MVFVIACSNVANLILARSVRREGELAVRAALGAGTGALRRTLLAESLVLCGAGAVLGVVLARPLVAMVSRYAARFSIRALEVTVDPSVLWVGAGLAMAAAVLLAYVPRLPVARTRPATASAWRAAASGSRPAPTAACASSRRPRLRSRSCCSPARACCSPRSSPCRRRTTGYDMRQVLAFDIPTSATGHRRREGDRFLSGGDAAHQRAARRRGRRGRKLRALARRRQLGPGFLFTVEGYTPADGEENPRGRMRIVAPRFFAVLGVPIVAGRDFTDEDRARQRARVDRQPERRAAAVPERRRGEPAPDVDRSAALRASPYRPASSASSPTWTTRTSCRNRR